MATSLLDIFDDLPEDEKETLKWAHFQIGQQRKAERAKKLLPERARRYYISQFNMDQFVGFACCACKCWLGNGHDDNCPMHEIMPPDFDYQGMEKLLKEA